MVNFLSTKSFFLRKILPSIFQESADLFKPFNVIDKAICHLLGFLFHFFGYLLLIFEVLKLSFSPSDLFLVSFFYLFVSDPLHVNGFSKRSNVGILFLIHLRKGTIIASLPLKPLLLLCLKNLIHDLISVVCITPALLFLIASICTFLMIICIAFIV